MADAHGSGPCDSNIMRVQVPFPALFIRLWFDDLKRDSPMVISLFTYIFDLVSILAVLERYDIEKEVDERRERLVAGERRDMIRAKRKRIWYLRLAIKLVLILVFLIGCIVFAIQDVILLGKLNSGTEEVYKVSQATPMIDKSAVMEKIVIDDEPEPEEAVSFAVSEGVESISTQVVSEHAILVDLNTNSVVAGRDFQSQIYPASMTKIMTVLVAAEHVTDLEDKFTITPEINYFSYKNDCSAVGFADNEVVTVKDLLYGTILPSGADAAAGLATYVAGDMDSFVEMMNEKCAQLGIAETTHFANVVGIYDDNNYSTCKDMAIILNAAMSNDICKEVLSAHTYTTTPTPEHPDGINISNWFLRRIEDRDCGATVLCAKTGFVVQSRNCAASYAEDDAGNRYICVTTNSASSWRCIFDHVVIYRSFFPGYTGDLMDDITPIAEE